MNYELKYVQDSKFKNAVSDTETTLLYYQQLFLI